MMKTTLCIAMILASLSAPAAANKSSSGLNPKASNKALSLLARGGVARVYPDSILAEVNSLNCNVDRMAATKGKADATVCTGSSGQKKLSLQGEKAAEMFQLLESVTVAQNLPAGDSIEVKKMKCHFSRRAGANCTVIK